MYVPCFLDGTLCTNQQSSYLSGCWQKEKPLWYPHSLCADLRVYVCVCARIKNKLDPAAAAAAASAGDFRLHAADKVGLLYNILAQTAAAWVDVYYFSPPLHIIPLAWLIILAPRQQKSEKYIYIMLLSSQAAVDSSWCMHARTDRNYYYIETNCKRWWRGRHLFSFNAPTLNLTRIFLFQQVLLLIILVFLFKSSEIN